ncbi:MAG: aminoacyl-tRNA hydrolase [Candidatus Dojkabacteria bacterium]|jgi:PTH1 family peptidyl-tRNA hydrolase
MKLITGLGNPDKKHENTRHNTGFMCIDVIRDQFLYQKDICVTEWKKEKTFNSKLSFLKHGSRIVAIFQKPLTYMNNSGEAVQKLIKKYEIEDLRDNFILIHDDLDIELGKFKIQIGKSPKGHNGVNDVIQKLKTDEFMTVRVGIESRQNRKIEGEDFVLMNFSADERLVLDEVMEDIARALLAEILL